MQFALFFAAAVFEIGGCYLVWLSLKQGAVGLLAPALVSLLLFAGLLALTGRDSAGRVFAVYGGIYIATSLVFMATVERVRPDGWDLLGALICLIGAAVIFFAPRS